MALGSDLFFWNNSPYLLVSDYYSKFPLVRKLDNIRSDTIVAHMKAIFEEHGIPSKLVTGNDTQFTSALFQEFSSTYGFDHVTTSPYFPEANGFIERTVQTVKNLLQKCMRRTSMTEPEPTSPAIGYTTTPSAQPSVNIPTSEQITTATPNTPCPTSPAELVSSEVPLCRSSRMVKPPDKLNL